MSDLDFCGDRAKKYQAELFTQLILHNLSVGQAAILSEDATNKLQTLGLPFPVIIVG